MFVLHPNRSMDWTAGAHAGDVSDAARVARIALTVAECARRYRRTLDSTRHVSAATQWRLHGSARRGEVVRELRPKAEWLHGALVA
jgi:hypothetical protein